MASTRNEFSFSAWDAQQATIHALHKTTDEAVRDDVATAYADLRRTHLRGAARRAAKG